MPRQVIPSGVHCALLFWLPVLTLAAADSSEKPLPGTWIPYSRSYEAIGTITITQQTLSWGRCKDIPYQIIESSQQSTYPGPVPFRESSKSSLWGLITIKLSPSTCNSFIDRNPYLQFAIPLDPGIHDTHLTTYHSPEEFKDGSGDGIYSWGIVNKAK